MRKHAAISFDKQYLNQLKEDTNSCVEIYNDNEHLCLHPFQLANLNTSIKELLNRNIARYNRRLNGIILGYQNISLLSDKGAINYDSCYIHLDVQADFYIFKPSIGKELTGIVNKKSTDHVGVLVHNTFNVSLPKSTEDEDWLGQSANIGNEVLFKITHTDLELRLPYIRGEIISINNNTTSEVTNKQSVKKINKKFANEEVYDITTEHKMHNNEEKKKSKKDKKTSKQKRADDSLVQDILNTSDSILKKKKKKDKKQKSKTNSKEEDEISIPDLNLGELFSSPDKVSLSFDTVNMVDAEDKQRRKRYHSSSMMSLSFDPPEDSDLDKMFTDKFSKKRKRSSSESHSPKKRKKSE